MKALVLAGGFPQIALIKELKSRGIEVLLADYNVSPVAKPYADQYYQVSTLDVQAITEVAKKENVDFLITACTDQALLTVAQVSETLGLPCYIDYQTALNVTNKAYMKQVLVENGISTARHVIMKSLDWEKIEPLFFPLIVKPVDCNSSKGVKKVQNREELSIAFAEAAALSRTKSVVVEEFIDGPELTADIYVENGTVHVLTLSNNDKIANQDSFVIFRTRYPAASHDAFYHQVQEIAQQIVDAFQLKNCPMLLQMITDGKKAYVIEFSARTGGGAKYLLVQRATGFDVISAVVDLTLGKYPHVEKVNMPSQYIVNEAIYCKPGVFDHLEGFDELVEEGILLDYYQFKWRGAKFDTVSSSADRVGMFTIQAYDLDELQHKHLTAVEKLRIVDENGNDMMRHDLLIDVDTYYR